MASPRLKTKRKYQAIIAEAHQQGTAVLKETLRTLCRKDLFYLLVYILNRADADKDWLFDRCREVEANPDGCLDLWAREHYKSTIITIAKTIQDILKNPEITIGIFSHTRKIAKSFLIQIKSEFEKNKKLKWLFDDILFERPERDAPKWSVDDGIIVKRKSNPKEATIEAWGLVDGQPTSKHFKLMIYDDVVTLESVNTPEQIQKTTAAWEMSLNLGAQDGVKRYIGTRYHYFDTYSVMIERGIVAVRKYAATDNGKFDGKPVFMTQKYLDEKRAAMGPYTFGSQMLQDPVADRAQSFKLEWLRYYEGLKYAGMNLFLICDSAGSKTKGSDYTVMEVWALGSDGNEYLVDGIRDRMNLTQRGKKFIELHRKWRPLRAGYERYGLMSDIEYIKTLQEQENYRFDIYEFGGCVPKFNRIQMNIPRFEKGNVWFPHRLLFIDCEGKTRDFVAEYIKEEYINFPLSQHDDMMDIHARLRGKAKLYGKETDFAVFPQAVRALNTKPLFVNTKEYDWRK